MSRRAVSGPEESRPVDPTPRTWLRPEGGIRTLQRISSWALGSVLVIVLSGTRVALAQVGTLNAVVTTPYGRILALEVCLVVTTVVIAAYKRLRLLPSLNHRANATLRARGSHREPSSAPSIDSSTSASVTAARLARSRVHPRFSRSPVTRSSIASSSVGFSRPTASHVLASA